MEHWQNLKERALISRILNGVGLMLHVPACMAAVSIVVVLIFKEDFALISFLWTAFSGLAIGQLLYQITKNDRREFEVLEMMWIVSLGWLSCSFLATLPFYLTANSLSVQDLEIFKMRPFRHWVNSHFEALSGLTTTGLTMTISESDLPYSLQWWRSFLQWIGGIGIIVFVSTVYDRFLPISNYYSQSVTKDEMLPDVEVRWYRIWWIYLLFTGVSVLLLWAQGIVFWEALNHAMTGISTGGFSVTNDSAGGYDNELKASMAFIIILGALNFNLYHLWFLKGQWRKFLKNQQHIFLFSFVAGGTVYLFLENNLWYNLDVPWMDLAFQMTSAVTTTGFMTTGLDNWSAASLLLLTVAKLVGGATASTAGGIKILRLLLLIKGNIFNTLQWAYRHEKKLRFKWHGKTLSHEESLKLYRNVATFHFFWILIFTLVFFILMHNVPENFRLSEIVFESASALGNTGLTTGITAYGLNNIAKLDLMAAMLVGRLELVPVVVLFATILKTRKEKNTI